MSSRQPADKSQSGGSLVQRDGKSVPSQTLVEDYASKDIRDRAKVVLGNHQLLMKYAVENDLSMARTRFYFEQVAAGLKTEALIKNWYPA